MGADLNLCAGMLSGQRKEEDIEQKVAFKGSEGKNTPRFLSGRQEFPPKEGQLYNIPSLLRHPQVRASNPHGALGKEPSPLPLCLPN